MGGGHRAHELARKGKSVPLAARSVTITSIRVHGYEWPFLDASIDCGKGTYIRSIARDLGTALGVGGLVESLRRTRVGPFTAESAVTLGATTEAVLAKVQPVTAPIAGMVRVTITAEDEARFRCGQALPLPPDWGGSVEAAVLDERGELVGIADADGGLRPRIVLAKRP